MMVWFILAKIKIHYDKEAIEKKITSTKSYTSHKWNVNVSVFLIDDFAVATVVW